MDQEEGIGERAVDIFYIFCSMPPLGASSEGQLPKTWWGGI